MNLTTKTIEVLNDESVFTLRVSKVKIMDKLKTLGLFLFTIVYMMVLWVSFETNATVFYELIKVGLIFSVIALIRYHMHNTKKILNK